MQKAFASVLMGLFLAFSTVLVASERYSIVANNEKVGHIFVEQQGSAVDIDYVVSDNGRGPKHKEHLVLAADGIPTEWSIEGTSLMGGSVSEHARWKAGQQSWISQADHGEVQSASARLYIGNDASPWALGLYARALMKAPGHTLKVLPSGELKLEKLRAVTVPQAGQLSAWLLSGVSLTPELILMDSQNRLFAQLSSELVIREGYEGQYEALQALGQTLTLERLQAVQKRVAHIYDVPIRFRNVPGVMYFPSEIYAELGIRPLAQPPTVTQPGPVMTH